MVGLSKRLLVALPLLVVLPQVAAAGGGEFAADGTRGLGRGGTGFTRADDPTVMLRNPALLADLWDDQAMIQSHLLLQDACFHPVGSYDWGLDALSAHDLGDGPVILQELYMTDASGGPMLDAAGEPILATPVDVRTGQPLGAAYGSERYAEVCYQGANLFLPSAALTVKLSDELGVGLGFFPPETMQTPQFGNADGTVDTPNGKRPARTRFMTAGSNRVVSYFSLMGAMGWRPLSWLRIGAGFQWSLVVFNTRTWGRPATSLNPATDVMTDGFGRDLFVPGAVASVHIVPFDALDLAAGFKWSERISTTAKLDITTSPWGLDQPLIYRVGEVENSLGATATPFVTHNRAGRVDAPPIWAPQLSFGARYADRLRPRPKDWKATREAAGDAVEDHMSTERWDIEVNAVFYMNSSRDHTDFDSREPDVNLAQLNPDGGLSVLNTSFGVCTRFNADGTRCDGYYRTRREVGGIDQYSVRVGGDYNLFPGLFSLRGGVSYETDGVDPEFYDPTNPDLARMGLHAGFTLRMFEKTDFSFGVAMFLQREVDLGVNEENGMRLMGKYRLPEYGFKESAADGIGRFEVPYNNQARAEPGPHFANSGTGWYDLTVLSATLTQHF